jgi:cytosine/uracil/thiamine/allantoin permease
MQIQTQEDLISKLTTIGGALAGILTLVVNSGAFTLWDTLAGGLLLILLLTYVKHGDAGQTRIEHALSSAVFALSSLLLFGWFLQPIYLLLGLERVKWIFLRYNLSFSWTLFSLALWLLVTYFWMRIYPRQHWPKLFQAVVHH